MPSRPKKEPLRRHTTEHISKIRESIIRSRHKKLREELEVSV